MVSFALFFGLSTSSVAAAGEPVVWAGIDYAFVRMIGTGDFNEPEEIFPGYLDKWNALWIEEMVPEMRTALRSEIIVDVAGVASRNRTATVNQIERRDGGKSILDETTITSEMLAAEVKSYTLAQSSGQGLVIVADRLVKLQEMGCGWVVWFDVGTRAITSQTRMCTEAGGFGFRNYWFHPFKDMVPSLRKLRPG